MDQQTRGKCDGHDSRRLVLQLEQTRLPDGRSVTSAHGVPANILGSPRAIEIPENSLAVMRDLITPALGKSGFLGCMEEEVETDGTCERRRRTLRIEAEGQESPASMPAARWGAAEIVSLVAFTLLLILAACGLIHLVKG